MHEFDTMFERLSRTRQRYEELRTAGDSLEERAQMLDHLHRLRADMSALRRRIR